MTSTLSDEAYRSAGVDLDRAQQVVNLAKAAAQKTLTGNTANAIGSFSGGFEIPPGYRQPVLLCACDGVGTKLKLAFDLNCHNTVGIDLVAMNVNDLLANGGQPLVFLDYIATGKIEPDTLAQVLDGIAEGCRQAGCTLSGGETAEMPGFYQNGEYDLAGFSVGIVEKQQQLPRPDAMAAGDVLIGLASSGLHSNGYSLVRKIVAENGLNLHDTPEDFVQPLGNTLLTPTTIYVKPVLALLNAMPETIKGMVHVTGGGFVENVPRVLPTSLAAYIEKDAWPKPAVFNWLQHQGSLSDKTMSHTFNWGIGYVLVVPQESSNEVLTFFDQPGMPKAYRIGMLTPRTDAPVVMA